MSEELKPCPFCGPGTHLQIYRHGPDEPDCFVQCDACTTCGPTSRTSEQAAAAWNRRANEPEPESVPIPTTVNMARMMLGLGYRYLQDNAPEHLTASTIPASDPGELPSLPSPQRYEPGGSESTTFTADQMRAYGKECARAALASTRTASEQEIVTAGDCMARWLYGLSQSEVMPESWRTTCAELAQAWKGTASDTRKGWENKTYFFSADESRTASDTRTAAGEAECDVARPDLELLRRLVNSEVGRDTLRKLAEGQGTATEDGRAWLDAATRCRAEGGNTCKESGQVDVEAERKLCASAYEAIYTGRAEGSGFAGFFKGWLAKARTQADAGKADTTTKLENT